MITSAEIRTTEGLYWEAKGHGRPVLLIAGTPGDGGQFDRVAGPLADDHLVITYDRRGTSRSERLNGWQTTSLAEQADDAARVLSAVGVDDAIAFGTSNGAAVALELAVRHPDRVAGTLLHEPPLLSVLSDPEPVASAIGWLISDAMQAGGPPAALAAFLRFAFGDDVVAGWTTEFRDRMLANAQMVFAVELPAFQSYRPDSDALARMATPFGIVVGEQQELPFFREVAEWLARHLGADVVSAPGAHGPQFTHPRELASLIDSFCRRWWCRACSRPGCALSSRLPRRASRQTSVRLTGTRLTSGDGYRCRTCCRLADSPYVTAEREPSSRHSQRGSRCCCSHAEHPARHG
jgi:pimeloyl-ACP methyl ester carboxylesterase